MIEPSPLAMTLKCGSATARASMSDEMPAVTLEIVDDAVSGSTTAVVDLRTGPGDFALGCSSSRTPNAAGPHERSSNAN